MSPAAAPDSGGAPAPGSPEAWLALCRAAAADVAAAVAGADMATRAGRSAVVGEGEGGDQTTAVDARAEAAILARLERFHAETGTGMTVVSEEVGELVFGTGAPWRLVVDPIDGSVNAKRGIPFWSVSIAVADGPALGDVAFGYVKDFGSGEEWWAVRGGGAFLDGQLLGAELPNEEIEILSLEATLTARVAARVPHLVGVAARLRIMGSLALSLCHLAAGRVDAVVSLKEARSVDIAAAQLLCREVGLALELFEDPPFAEGPLDLQGRSRIVAARSAEGCARLAAALRA